MSSKPYPTPPPPTKPDTGTTETRGPSNSPVPKRQPASYRFTGFSTISAMADAASLDERLEQIGTQLDWVRDYL